MRLLGPLPLGKFALQLSPGSKFPLLSFWGMVWGAGLTEACLRDIAGSAPSYCNKVNIIINKSYKLLVSQCIKSYVYIIM